MTYTEQAIKIAIENGWEGASLNLVGSVKTLGVRIGLENKEKVCLDPLFWQALEKGLGWHKHGHKYTQGGIKVPIDYGEKWQEHWHHFIDHLAEGKDIESFFIALLPPPQPCPDCVNGVAHPHK